jgi:hypothetical protein
VTRAERQAATDARLYSEGYRLGQVNGAAGRPLSAALAAQMATTPRGAGYIAGHAAGSAR